MDRRRKLRPSQTCSPITVRWLCGLVQAQDKPPAPGHGNRNGKAITEEELSKTAAPELESLEMQKLQYEATYARDRHQVLQNSLDRLIEGRLLAAEAARLGITQKELLATKSTAKSSRPRKQRLTPFSRPTRRVNQPKTRYSAGRQYLQRQAYEKPGEFIQRLNARYGATSSLESFASRLILWDSIPETKPARHNCGFGLPVQLQSGGRHSQNSEELCKTSALVYIIPSQPYTHDAFKAAEASQRAERQGRFWVYDMMFEEQGS
jgi:hypothetical protein